MEMKLSNVNNTTVMTSDEIADSCKNAGVRFYAKLVKPAENLAKRCNKEMLENPASAWFIHSQIMAAKEKATTISERTGIGCRAGAALADAATAARTLLIGREELVVCLDRLDRHLAATRPLGKVHLSVRATPEHPDVAHPEGVCARFLLCRE